MWHAKLTLHAHRFASDSIERVPVAVVMVHGGGTHHSLQALPLLLRRVSRCSFFASYASSLRMLCFFVARSMECQSVKKTHMMWPVVWHAKLTLHAHRFIASDSNERVPVAVVMVYGGGTHHSLQALPLLLRRVSQCSIFASYASSLHMLSFFVARSMECQSGKKNAHDVACSVAC